MVKKADRVVFKITVKSFRLLFVIFSQLIRFRLINCVKSSRVITSLSDTPDFLRSSTNNPGHN